MEEDRKGICWIRVAKNACYFVAPIILAALILSVLSIIYVYEVGIVKEESYFETKRFAEDYISRIYNTINRFSNAMEEATEDLQEKYQYNYGYYESEDIELNGKKMKIYYQHYTSNMMYLIVDNKHDVIYCNGDYGISYHMTLDELKNEILSNEKYWKYEDGKIDTTIGKLSEEKVKNSNFYKKNLQQGDYMIYTSIRNGLPYYDDYLTDSILYKVVKNQYENAIYNIPIAIVILIAMIPIVLIGIGKTKEKKGIYLTWFDRLPIEVATGILLLIGFVFCGIVFGIGTNIAAIISIICIAIGMIGLYIIMILFLETIVKRLKTHTFIKTTFAYWFYEKMNMIFSNMKVSLRVGVAFAGFVIANWFIFLLFSGEPFLAFILLMTLYITSFIYILKRSFWRENINRVIEQVYKGNTDVRLDETEMKGELRNVAIQVNDIAGGLSNAVEERLKSERLKTELITNVSHDIKTPLTSIINYVDLLKKEDITTEKAAEYLMILDNKSQRLKKLTEDLVEASKASSGNIKMNMEKLEVNELIKQVSAEFEDKFRVHGLEEIISFTKEPVYIRADSRYMYRVLENMYSNVSKYAMENSRVYTDIIEHGNNVIIQIKNISKDKLNITADELMQRFVRGDTSRNTEGSGLGLSIANSLTELQEGKFHIYLDGDLFKITIGFKKI